MKIFLGIQKQTHWKSCQYISDELQKRFAEKCPEGHFYFQDVDALPILNEKSTIFLYDHRWATTSTLNWIKEQSSYVESVVCYLYGDFSIRVKEFMTLMEALSGIKISLIVASEAQASLVKKIIPEASSSLQICPYPLDKKFEEPPVLVIRQPAPLKICYVGRLDVQKGVISLVRVFKALNALFPGKYQLKLVGDCEQAMTASLLADLMNGECVLVSGLGRDVEKLKNIYQESDVLVSPSTFHDEDYGLTVAEALSQGTPCLITKWGGYQDFIHQFPDLVTGIDVTMSEKGAVVNEASLLHALASFSPKTRVPAVVPFKLPEISAGQGVTFKDNHLRERLLNGEKLDHAHYLELYSGYLLESVHN